MSKMRLLSIAIGTLIAISLLVVIWNDGIPDIRAFTREKDEPERQVLDDAKMVYVKGGTFQMGNILTDSDGKDGGKSVHTVQLTYDYYIGKTEVTFNEYDAYCEATGNKKPSDYWGWKGYYLGRGNKPVINVNWHDAIYYCNWLSEQAGLAKAYDNDGNLLDKNGKPTTDITKVEGYRLPTEAEWEYAARGGHQSTGDYKYAGSDDSDTVGWFENNSDEKTHEVAQKAPNELGIYDMSGNVSEWCHDYWEEDDIITAKTNPIGPGHTDAHGGRGGCWGCEVEYSSIYKSFGIATNSRYDYIGFRIARTRN